MSTSEDNLGSRFLGVGEIAKLLNCSPRTIYAWISQGAIPYRKAGRRIIFDESEIRNWTKPDPDSHQFPILTKR